MEVKNLKNSMAALFLGIAAMAGCKDKGDDGVEGLKVKSMGNGVITVEATADKEVEENGTLKFSLKQEGVLKKDLKKDGKTSAKVEKGKKGDFVIAIEDSDFVSGSSESNLDKGKLIVKLVPSTEEEE